MAVRKIVVFTKDTCSIQFPSWVEVSNCNTHTHHEIVKGDPHGVEIYISTYKGLSHSTIYCQNRAIVREVKIR